jgi:hypothetical protein
MRAASDWPVIASLAFNTLLIAGFTAVIIWRDLPLASLPIVGRYFRKPNYKIKQTL